MIWFFCDDGLVCFSFGGTMGAAIVVLFSWIFLGFVAAWLLCGVFAAGGRVLVWWFCCDLCVCLGVVGVGF